MAKIKIPARRPDWDKRFALVVAEHIRTPQAWGSSDCITRVSDVVLALTGFDPAEKIRGKYSTGVGAAKLLNRRNCDNVEQLLDKYFEPVGKLKAQRGDLVTVEDDGVIAAAYVTEYGVAVSTERGTFFRPQTSDSIRKAYKVGR
jgi:hypothetical protein